MQKPCCSADFSFDISHPSMEPQSSEGQQDGGGQKSAGRGPERTLLILGAMSNTPANCNYTCCTHVQSNNQKVTVLCFAAQSSVSRMQAGQAAMKEKRAISATASLSRATSFQGKPAATQTKAMKGTPHLLHSRWHVCNNKRMRACSCCRVLGLETSFGCCGVVRAGHVRHKQLRDAEKIE